MDRVSPRRKKRGVRLAVAYTLQVLFALLAVLLVALLICGVLYVREHISPPAQMPPDTTSRLWGP